MTEMKFQELMNKNQCPAEWINNHEDGDIITYDCKAFNYDCRTCVEGHIREDK